MSAHASPNIITDGLAFMYDTGSGKSYKGEPTTIYGDPFPGETTLPGGFYWSYEYDHEIVDAPIAGHFLSNRKWIKSTRDTSGSTRVLFINNSFTAGSTYTFSCYAYSTDASLTSLAHVSHNGGYSSTQNTTTYGTSDLGTVKRIHGTWIQQVNGGPIFGMQTNNTALGTTFYITGLQVEEKTRATQLTGGSRSATQGLLDLTGNSTIDISNASFDSNAQMTFDGTDDQLTVNNIGIDNYSEAFSYECVFKAGGTWANDRISNIVGIIGSYGGHYGLGKSGTNTINFVVRDANYNAVSGTVSDTSAYHHLVGVWDQSNSQIRLYIDGELKSSASVTKTGTPDSNDLRIGGRAAFGGSHGSYYHGNIPIVKYYKTALTSAEVLQNFNATKDRFGL